MKDIYFYDAEKFEYTLLLETNLEVIQKELMAILHKDATNWTSAYPNYLSENATWKTFEFVFFGIHHTENQKLCPNTTSILNQIPELITAQFSVLHPQSHILPHKGYSKLILRNHLPLIVPEGKQCGIKIEDETHYWQKGKMVVFDDSFMHEAWNQSNETRVILMFDIAKPDCGYSAAEICHYKIENLTDENLLKIADKSTWKKWLHQGYFNF